MTAPQPQPVQNPLTLVMKAKSLEDYTALKKAVEHLQSLPPDQNPITVALNQIDTVHFARFTFIDNNQLAVITEYDGTFEEYINAFIDKLGDVFDNLLQFVENAPSLPIKDNRQAFLDYIQAANLGCVGTLYSAYPTRTVRNILGLPDNWS